MELNLDKVLVFCAHLLLTLPSSIVGDNVVEKEYDVYLEVTDDNGYVDIWTYKSDQLDVDMVHEKAADLMKSALRRRYRSNKNNATSFADPDEEANETPFRKKRAAETSVDCREKLDYLSTITGIVAQAGETVRVPCHFCDDAKRKALDAKVWYKFNREDIGGEAIFNALQLKLDKHDDAKLNRVYLQPDHTLVIEKFQLSDTGTYFCDPYNSEEFARAQPFSFRVPGAEDSSAAAILLGWKVVSGTTGLTFMTIIDIMSHVTSELVSYVLAAYPKPTVPKKNTGSNWITYTEWGEWGECSKCGDNGVKKRPGKCMVRKIFDTALSKPAYLDEALKLYPRGAPCQSSLFTDQSMMDTVRNEIEVQPCSLPCGNDATSFLGVRIAKHVAGKTMGFFKKSLNTGQVPTVPPFTQQGIEQEEGTHLKLYCPSVYEDSEVVWKKDREVMNPSMLALNTSGRIKFDEFLRLVFKYLEVDDSGHYACYVDFKATVDYFLKVSPTVVKHGPWVPGIYVIGYWYSAAGLLFLCVSIVKHTQRFDNTRARAYRTKAAVRKAKGYAAYKDVYGDHGRNRNFSVNANITTNANSANNWNSDDVMTKLLMAFKRLKVNQNLNNTNSDKFTGEESILTASSSSPETTSFTTTSTSPTSESVVETDLESVDLSSSDEEYSMLDSSSDWEVSSHYSATGADSEIPDEPAWMIF